MMCTICADNLGLASLPLQDTSITCPTCNCATWIVVQEDDDGRITIYPRSMVNHLTSEQANLRRYAVRLKDFIEEEPSKTVIAALQASLVVVEAELGEIEEGLLQATEDAAFWEKKMARSAEQEARQRRQDQRNEREAQAWLDAI
jgi:hypothetical protein